MGILRDPWCRAREKLRYELARQLDVCLGDAREERRRGLVAGDVQSHLADDRAGVGAASTISKSVTPVRASPVRIVHGIGARPRCRGRSVGCMPKTPSRASAMNGSRTSCDHPTTKIELGLELANRRGGLLGVDVTGLVEVGPETRCDLVERALPRAIGVDRPRQRDDSDDLGPHVGRRLEAVAADRVEAHPDRAHRRAMV